MEQIQILVSKRRINLNSNEVVASLQYDKENKENIRNFTNIECTVNSFIANTSTLKRKREDLFSHDLSTKTNIIEPLISFKILQPNSLNKIPSTHFLEEIYKKIDRETNLLFGVDKDIENLPEKRQRKKRNLGIVSATEILQKRKEEKEQYQVPDTVSPGYGEISQPSFSKILNILQMKSNQKK